MPKTVDEVFRWNDVELYDLENDPDEMTNLATDRAANEALIGELNAKLDATIQREMGKDDGRELPDIPFVSWELERFS
jgi:arylsulfatase